MLDERLQHELIAKGRAFMRGYRNDEPYMKDFESDQDLKRPQPRLVKAPMAPLENRTVLPRDFSDLELDWNLATLFHLRKSSRLYTGEKVTLLQLSFLLWATQGIKKLRGKGYATLRTVPCGGARHEFETYLLVTNVEDLSPGIYHYLPMEHAVEYLGDVEDMENNIAALLCGQSWASKANVVFFWSMVAYRAEWRYGIYAHRTALIDAGHIGQNLYLACTGLGLGTCGIAAFAHDLCNKVFMLDGEEEYVVYTAPVGTIHAEDAEAEEITTYGFVYEAGL